MAEPINEYIAANRDRYTREAITQQLVEAGYRREDVDAAWLEVERAQLPPAPPAAAEAPIGSAFWRPFWLLLVGANVVVFLLVGLVTGFLTTPGGDLPAVLFGIVLLVGMGLTVLMVAGLRPTRLARRRALLVGAVVTIAMASLLGGTALH
jgi:hypothetical protein